MSPYWKNVLKSVGYAALAGLYGLGVVVFAEKAKKHRDKAVNATDGKMYCHIETSASTQEESDAIHNAASTAASAKMLELKNRKADAEKATPKAGS
jgi:hypothetical protein